MHKNVYSKSVYGKESEKNNKYLTCKAVKFYTLKDEDAFFEWIKKIKCIKTPIRFKRQGEFYH